MLKLYIFLAGTTFIDVSVYRLVGANPNSTNVLSNIDVVFWFLFYHVLDN